MKSESFFGLSLQKQPTSITCVQACIAMALSVPVEHVISRYGDSALNQEDLQRILSECQFVWNRFINGTMVFQGWYFACVPSLNHVGGNHQILLHWTQDAGLLVLDPAIGKTYRQDGKDLISWNDLTPFWPGGRLPSQVKIT